MKYYINKNGYILGSYDQPPEGGIELSEPPKNGYDKYVNGKWIYYKPEPSNYNQKFIKRNDKLYNSLITFGNNVISDVLPIKNELYRPYNLHDYQNDVRIGLEININPLGVIDREKIQDKIVKIPYYQICFTELVEKHLDFFIPHNLENDHREFIKERDKCFAISYSQNLLLAFSIYIVNNCTNSTEFINETVYKISLELIGAPSDLFCSLWLYGITLEEDKLELIDGIVARRPTCIDIDNLELNDRIISINISSPELYKESVILDYTIHDWTFDQNHNLFKVLCTLFRLYKVCSVDLIRYQYKSKGIMSPGSPYLSPNTNSIPSIYHNISNNARMCLSFLRADIEHFKRLYDRLFPIIAFKELPLELKIAIERYDMAVLNNNSPENRITFVVNSLEALFLYEKDELVHRFSQRISQFLKLINKTNFPLETYTIIKDAYSIRSRYIHGVINKNQGYEIYTKVLDYCRICILAYYQFFEIVTKNDLIKALDNSLLDDEEYNKLKNLLSNNVTIC
jgi:hypothetical protein